MRKIIRSVIGLAAVAVSVIGLRCVTENYYKKNNRLYKQHEHCSGCYHSHISESHECGDHENEHTEKPEEPLIDKIEIESWADISENAAHSVGQLFAFCNLYNWLEPYKTPEQKSVSGTAFFIDAEGHMLTNAHCVDQAISLFIQLPRFGKHRFEVQLVALCHERDLALLKLTPESYDALIKEVGSIPYMKFGDSNNVRRADEIMALGFPLGQEWLKSTTGVVSGIQSLGNKSLIQISAPINPGNSGGPALNEKGQVVGISTLVINQSGVQNVGYIIPCNEAMIFLNHTKATRALQKDASVVDPLLIRIPMAGITYHGSPVPLISYLNNPEPGGIYIVNVIPNSICGKAGIKPGDMIYSLNGHEVDRFGDLNVPWSHDKISISTFISQLRIGDTIHVVLYRNGKREEISTLWEIKPPLPVRFMYPGYETMHYLVIGGMVITPVTLNHVQLLTTSCTDELASYWKLMEQTKPAIMIAHVLPNSVAQHSRLISPGMIITHVNDQETSTIEECEKALQKSIKTGYITFKMKSKEFFVAKLDRVLDDELKLSKMYFYHISPVVQSLMNTKQQEPYKPA